MPARARADLADGLPDWIEPLWWHDPEELVARAPEATIGWFDLFEKPPVLAALRRAERLEWLFTAFAGVDWLPLADLDARGVRLSCGSGLNADAVAEFAVMQMLGVARGFREIVRAQDRGEWLSRPPRQKPLAGSRALLLGYGAIGQALARMLAPFGVEIVPVTRSGAAGTLGPDEWRGQLGTFDWVVLALPGTPETAGLIDAQALAAMKADAVLVNVARADVVDQAALVEALRAETIGGAVLDLSDPEPLPPGHALWSLPNAHVTMHLSGMPTPITRARSAERFVTNCERWREGAPLVGEVDLARGY